MSPKKSLLPLLACMALAACDSNSGVQTDTNRSLNAPRAEFVPANQVLKVQSLDHSELREMFACEEVSTETRLDKDQFSISHQIVARSQSEFSGPVVVKVEEFGYSTKNKGKLFNTSYALLNQSINGVSTLVEGPYSFTIPCTASEGCDEEKKTFQQGDGWTVIKTDKHHKQMLYKALSEVESYNCEFSRDDEDDSEPVIQQGSVEVSGVERKAIQISQSLKGKILCRVNGTDPTNGSSSRLEPIGDSVYSYRKIILADTLPGVNQTTNEGGCSRTQFFSSQVTTLNGKVFSGESIELADYRVSGEVQTVEEWETEKQNIIDTRKRLENAVTIAFSNKEAAETRYTNAVAETKRLKAKQAEAETIAAQSLSELNVTPIDDPTYAQKKAKSESDSANAIQAKVTAEKAYESELSAKDAYDRAALNLQNAEDALTKFNIENPS